MISGASGKPTSVKNDYDDSFMDNEEEELEELLPQMTLSSKSDGASSAAQIIAMCKHAITGLDKHVAATCRSLNKILKSGNRYFG